MVFYSAGDVLAGEEIAGVPTLRRYSNAVVHLENIAVDTSGGPVDVKVAPDGHVYVLLRSGANRWLRKIDKDSKAASTFYDFGAVTVLSFACGADGNFYAYKVSGSTPVVVKIDSAGTLLGETNLGGDSGFSGIYLLSDNTTLLYNAFKSGVSPVEEAVHAYDLDTDTQLALHWDPDDPPGDASGDPWAFDFTEIVVPAEDDIIVSVEQIQNIDADFDTTVALGRIGASPVYYQTGAEGDSGTDGGFDVALDPDGLHVWVSSIQTARLHKFLVSDGSRVASYGDGTDNLSVFTLAPGCQPVLLLGSSGDFSTEPGKVARRVGETWAITREAPALTAAGRCYYYMTADQPDYRRVYVVEAAGAGALLRSDDAGASWAENPWINFAPVAADPNSDDLYYQDRTTAALYKSTDLGATWTVFHSPAGTWHDSSIWITEGWLWFIDQTGVLPTATISLKRIRTDGTDEETVTTLPYTVAVGTGALRGTRGIATFYLYRPSNDDDWARIDVTGADTYTLTTFVPSPVSGVRDVVPLSSTRALLQSPDEIWKTDDAGLTWIMVINDADIGSILQTHSYTIAVRPDLLSHVAVLGVLPYYFECSNALTGLTFTKKSVGVVTAPGDGVWNTIGWANTCAAGGGGEPAPTVRRRRSSVWVS